MRTFIDMGGSPRRERSGRWLSLALPAFVFVCCAPLFAAPPAGLETLQNSGFLRLKTRFETLIRRSRDPEAISCLAVETTALAWTLAAARLAEDPETRAFWVDRAADFEKSRSASRDWDERLRLALAAYYRALRETAALLLASNPDLAGELKAVADKAESALAALGESPDADLEKEALAAGLMELAAILARSWGEGGLAQPAELILRSAAREAETARRRGDLHYRGRLAFVYAAHVQGLTDLVFLLSQAVEPPLGRDLEAVRTTLNKATADRGLPDALSLAWVAQTQAALPLAYRLSARPGAPQ